jgi:hypothetical protein
MSGPHLQRTVAVPRDPQETHGGRLPQAALRQGVLPPQIVDAGDAALVLDRLPKLLVDDSHLGGGRQLAVPYAREAEEIARKLRAARMEDEGSAHSESCTKKAGFENDIVSRRGLTGSRGRGRGLSDHRREGEVELVGTPHFHELKVQS